MPSTPYIVSGTVYTSNGSVSNSVVRINSELVTTTDDQGQYLLDIANFSDGYTDGSSYTIESWDEFENEYKTDTFTVAGGGLTKDVYLDSRDVQNDLTKGSDTRREEIRSIGNKPVSQDNLLPVQSNDRIFTQKLAYVSGTSRTEYVGEAAPGTPVGQAKWRIKKLVYNSSNYTTDIVWANGSGKFDKIWSSRASYSYA